MYDEHGKGRAMILKNLWQRKTRTLLMMLGIAIGVAAMGVPQLGR